MKDFAKWFEKMRFNKNKHLGLGDVRITPAEQEQIVSTIRALESWIEQEGEQTNTCTRNILGCTCSYCQCGRLGHNAGGKPRE